MAARVSSLPLCSSSPMESRPTRGLGLAQNDRASRSRPSPRTAPACAGSNPRWRPRPPAPRANLSPWGKPRPAPDGRHSGYDALHDLGGGHDRAGVASRYQALRLAVAHQPGCHLQGAILLGADRLAALSSMVMTCSAWTISMGRSAWSSYFSSSCRTRSAPAHQDDLYAQTSGGLNSALNFALWGVITAHCIQRNGQHVGTGLLLGDFDHFAALVLPAVWTHAVG